MSSPENPFALVVNSLSVKYGGRTVVDRVNLSLRRGELMAVVGPSGSGKSTLLLAMAGLIDQPEATVEGEVCLGGEDISKWPANRRHLPMVFQSFALFPHLSILENVAFPLKVGGFNKSQIQGVTEECLKSVRLGEALHSRLPQEISGGEQQRVALARALAANALPGARGIVLMDEPLGSLDRQLRSQLQVEIKRLQILKSLTMLYVTHDQSEAMSMGNRLGVFNDGRLLQIGTAHDIYERPASEFVARFFGDANILTGNVVTIRPTSFDITLANSNISISLISGREVVVGQSVRVFIRPENFSLGEDRRALNRLEVTVLDQAFLGDRWMLTVQSKDGHSLRVTRLGSMAVENIDVGRQIELAWRSEDMVLLEG